MIQVCIDESGDTGYSKKSTKYFILCAVCVDDLTVLARIARDVQKSKNNKHGGILHTPAENIITKNKMIKKLIQEQITCIACVIQKKKTKSSDYYILATEMIARYFSNKKVDLILVAKRDLRRFYNQKILDIYKSHGIRATFSDPMKDKSLQIADFYSWSIFSFYENGNDEYFKKLSNHIKIIS